MKKSPLYGSKPILFVHDEIVLETKHDGSPESHKRCSDAARRLQVIMEKCMEVYTPNIPAIAEPTLTTKWVKDAESDILEDGLIDIWTPSVTPDDESEDDVIDLDEPDAEEIEAKLRIRKIAIATVDALYDNHFSSEAKARAKAGK